MYLDKNSYDGNIYPEMCCGLICTCNFLALAIHQTSGGPCVMSLKNVLNQSM